MEAATVKAAINPRQFYEVRLPDLKSGNGWVEGGRCPFHKDAHAGSFHVNLDTGSFNCFSCGSSGGDIIAFAMQHDGTDFPTTIKALAAEYGVAGVEATPEQRREFRQRRRDARKRDLVDGILYEMSVWTNSIRQLRGEFYTDEIFPALTQSPEEIEKRRRLAELRLTKMIGVLHGL